MGKVIGELPHPEPEGSLYLVVARSASVNFFSRLAYSLHQKTFNCSVAILITLGDGKPILKAKCDYFTKGRFKVRQLLVGEDSQFLKATGVSDRAKSITDDEVLVDEVIITDGECFHHRIKVVIFLPEFAHWLLSSLFGV